MWEHIFVDMQKKQKINKIFLISSTMKREEAVKRYKKIYIHLQLQQQQQNQLYFRKENNYNYNNRRNISLYTWYKFLYDNNIGVDSWTCYHLIIMPSILLCHNKRNCIWSLHKNKTHKRYFQRLDEYKRKL